MGYKRSAVNLEQGTKQCAKCTAVKSLTEFYETDKKRHYYDAYCRNCRRERERGEFGRRRRRMTEEERAADRAAHSAYSRARREAQDGLRREYFLRTLYRITTADYEALMSAQNAQCAICGEPPKEGRWGILQVDHNHLTGDVRGLLCRECNRGLGHFSDNAKRLRDAAAYLERVPAITRASYQRRTSKAREQCSTESRAPQS